MTAEGDDAPSSFSRTSIHRRGLAATVELLASAPADEKGGAVLLVASTSQEVESVLQALRPAGQAVFVLRFQPHDREAASGGNEEQHREFPSAYYRTALAWQVQDVLTALAYLTERAGFHEVQLAGFGEAGIPTLLARALVPTDKVRLAIADLAGLDGEDEHTWTGSRAQAGMLRLGGLRTAAILAAPGRLILHNVGAHLDTATIRTAYQAAGDASALETSESLWSVDKILRLMCSQM
jgi:hypothetical protein